MPRKEREYICSVCGELFKSRSIPPPKACRKKECQHEVRSKAKLLQGRDESKWIKKICPTCGKEFECRISRQTNYCSNKCWEQSEELKEITSKRYKSKSLKERGWTEEQIRRDKEIKQERNKKMKGKTFEELYGKEKAEELKEKISFNSSGDNNPMSYKKVMERNDVSLEEAKELMPATGRFGEEHPFYGKHHTAESKIKMMETFENGSSKGNISIGNFDGIHWEGSWELKFIIDCIENKISIKRYDLKPLKYFYNNKPHHYFPDFIINENTIIEIKGIDRNNGRTIEKMKQFKKKFNNYKVIFDVGQNQNPKTFLSSMKEKYGDRLEIKYTPYAEVNI